MRCLFNQILDACFDRLHQGGLFIVWRVICVVCVVRHHHLKSYPVFAWYAERQLSLFSILLFIMVIMTQMTQTNRGGGSLRVIIRVISPITPICPIQVSGSDFQVSKTGGFAMRCHNCRHHEAIQRGEFDSKPWNEIPCSSCKLGEDTFYSVPFDEENPPVVATRQASGSPLIPADVLAQFVQGFLSLPSELRDIVAWRYQGVPYKEIAQRQGTSIQLAEMRHKIAIRDWPVLQSLFPYKTAKRRRRLSRR